MTVTFRATGAFMTRARRDLERPHRFAAERVGFVAVRAAWAREDLVLYAQEYFPVADDEYLKDRTVGAKIGQEALRKALEIALLNPVGMFHVHMHGFPVDPFSKRLWFSRTDLREQLLFVPDFFKVNPDMPHGALVLSPDTAAGRVWLAPDKIEQISEFALTGAQIRVSRSAEDGSTDFYV